MEELSQPQSLPTDVTPGEMPAWQRRIVLGLLLGLLAFLATLEPQYGHFDLPAWLFEGEYVWLSYILFALPCLPAVWAAFRRQPLAARLPRALGLAACLGLVMTWASGRYATPEGFVTHAWVLFFPCEVLFLATLLTILRRRAGWRIGLDHEWANPETVRSQFSLRQLLLWTAACAVILSLDRWIASWGPNRDEPWWEALIFLAVIGGIGIFWLLLAVPCVGFALCPGSRRKFALWMVGMALLTSLLMFSLNFLGMYFGGGTNLSEILASSAVLAGSVPLAFLLAFLGVFGVLRLCGYRLVRTKAPYVAAAVTVEPRPVGRSPFPYLVGAMGLLALALVEPAGRIEQGRKQAAADFALQTKFAECGASVFVSQGQLLFLRFPPNQPISDAALQLVQHYHERIRQSALDLSNRQLSDAQLAYFAELPLGDLNLAGNPISDHGLAQLKHLEHVSIMNLSKAPITDEGLKSLRGCENLRELCLDGTRVTDAGLAQLGGLKNLTAIGLCGTSITDEGLKSLRGCEHLAALYLDGTQVTDAGLQLLAGLKGLVLFSAANTQVTDEGTAALVRALPNCRVLPCSPTAGSAVPATPASSGP